MITEPTEQPKLSFGQRIVEAGRVLFNGRPVTVNPLAEEPTDTARANLVQEWQKRIREDREFWEPTFKLIREEQQFAAGKQWPGDEMVNEWYVERYKGDVMQQLINRKVASLYAKNPTPEGKVVERMCYEVWDGQQESIDGARAILQQSAPMVVAAQDALASGIAPAMPPPPQIAMAQSIVADYERGMAEKALYESVAKTASKLLEQQWKSQSPEFTVSMKQLITRVITSRVAYVKVMYRRDAVPMDATQSANVMGLREKLATLKSRLDALAQEQIEPDSAESEEVKLMLQSVTQELQAAEQPEFEDEGIVYDFLTATSIIVDRNCRSLKEFVGAQYICHQMLMYPSDAEAAYGISLQDAGAMLYYEDEEYGLRPQNTRTTNSKPTDEKKAKVCVWYVEDKKTGLCYVLIDGVKDFIKEPYKNMPEVNRFWSIVALTLNSQEVEVNNPGADVTCYPRSDIRLAMPMQQDINTAGQGKREHRVANRPGWTAFGSKFEEGDLKKLGAPRAAHAVLRMLGLAPGEKVADYIQPIPTKPIDAAMYDNSESYQSMMMATGMQPSNLGAQQPDETATGQAIAEGSRISADQSNTEDVDFFLSTLAQMSWEMLIQEMPAETVKKLVGRGAQWPDISRDAIANEIYLQVEAGSSGKPNVALEVSKIEKIAPLMVQALQSGDMRLLELVKYYERVLNTGIDVDRLMKMPGPQMPMPPQGGKPPEAGSAPMVANGAKPPGMPPQQAQQAMASAKA